MEELKYRFVNVYVNVNFFTVKSKIKFSAKLVFDKFDFVFTVVLYVFCIQVVFLDILRSQNILTLFYAIYKHLKCLFLCKKV